MVSDLMLLNKAHSDMEWFRENVKDIRDKYQGNFVAVKNKRIVAVANNPHVLLNRVKKLRVKEVEVIIQFIPHKNQIVIY